MISRRVVLACAWLAVALVLAVLPAAAAAQTDPFEVEQEVSSATLRSQPLSDVPAAVSVISREDIRDFGFRTLAEALASVRGFFITNDRNYDYAGVRGFGPVGDWGSRILLMIDGQPLVGTVFLDSPIGRDLPVDMAAVERIEVVRGPGSTLYGTNAVFAIINVVTGQAGPSNGPAAGLGLGTDRRGWGFLEVGSRPDAAWRWFVHGSGFGGAGPDLYFRDLDAPPDCDGWARGVDTDRGGNLMASAVRRGWEMRAEVGRRQKEVPTSAWETLFNDDRTWTHDDWGLVSVQHLRQLNARTAVQGRLTLSRVRYDGQYMYNAGSGDSSDHASCDLGDGDMAEVDLRGYLQPLTSIQAVVGVEGQRHFTARLKTWYTNPLSVTQEINEPFWHGAAYGQAEWRGVEALTAQAGVRVEHDAHFGDITNPRLGLVWRPGGRWTLKALAGRAFRAPNLYELFYDDAETSKGNPDLEPEVVWSSEASAQLVLRPGTSLSVTGFRNTLDNWIGLTTDSLDGMSWYRNQDAMTVAGVETELSGRGPGAARWRLSYTFSDASSGTTEPPNFAAHVGQASLVSPLPVSRSRVAVLFHAVGPRRNYAGERIPGYGLVDLNLSTELGSAPLGVSFSLRNLLDQNWADPGGEEHTMAGIPGDGRVAQLQVRYNF